MRLAQERIVWFVVELKGNIGFRNMAFAGLEKPIASKLIQ